MKELFITRRNQFQLRCIKYSRYVFNDHFVLVLLVLLGFLALQYRRLLDEFPENAWGIYLFLALVSLFLLFSGKMATYLVPADEHFLLPKEGEAVSWVKRAKYRCFFVSAVWQLLGQLLLYPLYRASGMSLLLFLFFLALITVAKYAWFEKQLQSFFNKERLNWRRAIAAEKKRQQRILRFFSLFTRVKGISTNVRRRSYLDFFGHFISKKQHKTWHYLYLRSFLRSGDFLGLSLRLTLLSFVCLLTVNLSWLAIGLVLLLNYLLLFQLMAMYDTYGYQYLSQLYPLPKTAQKAGLTSILCGILYGVSGVQFLMAWFSLAEKKYLFLLAGGVLGLSKVYLPIKVKKLID